MTHKWRPTYVALGITCLLAGACRAPTPTERAVAYQRNTDAAKAVCLVALADDAPTPDATRADCERLLTP